MPAAFMATLERPVRLISTAPPPSSTRRSYLRLRLMGSTTLCGCIWSRRQASMTSGGTHSPSSSTNCTYSASGPTTAPKAASTVGTMRATRSMLSSRFILPARVGVGEAFHHDGAHAEPGEHPARHEAGDAPAEIHDDGGACGLLPVHGAFQALHELLHDAAGVDQLPYVPAVGSTVLLAHEGLFHRPLISLCYGRSVGGEKEDLYVIGVAAGTDVRPGRRLAGEHVVANDPGVGCPEVPDVDPRPQ